MESPSSHDLQVYGIVVTIILCFIVFGGVKMINRVAPAFLIAVLFSLLCIFIGIFLAKKDHPVGECNFLYLSYSNLHVYSWFYVAVSGIVLEVYFRFGYPLGSLWTPGEGVVQPV